MPLMRKQPQNRRRRKPDGAGKRYSALCGLFLAPFCGFIALALVPAGERYQKSEINRGSAYMTQQSYERALAEFDEALRLDPASAGAHVSRGIALLALGRNADAEESFRQALERDPDDARAHYNLGLAYRSEGDFESALKEFEAVRLLDSEDAFTSYFVAAAHFQLRNYPAALENYLRTIGLDSGFVSAYFGAGRSYVALQQPDQAQIYLDRFRALSAGSALNETVGSQYGEQGPYSRVAEPVEALERPAASIEVGFRNISADARLSAAGPAGCVIDYDRNGSPDLFAGSSLFRNNGARPPVFENVTSAARLPRFASVTVCAAGDYDNDNYPDLYLAASGAGVMLRNNRGQFADVTAAAGLRAARDVTAAAFVDLDHDGWLDLVAGQRGGTGLRVYRNMADGTFADITGKTGIGTTGPVSSIVATDHDNDRDVDLLFARQGQIPLVYSNNRDGTFSARSLPAAASGAETAVVFDFDKDARMDFFFTRSGAAPALLRNTATEGFVPAALPAAPPDGRGAAYVDFDNDGFLDLAFIARQNAGFTLKLLRNLGRQGFEDVSARTRLAEVALREPRRLIAADFDDDGDTDLAITEAARPPVLLQNDGGNRNGFLKLALTGFRDNKMALGTKVEIHGAGLRQKIEVHSGSPEVLFGTGPGRPDFVRFLWPTGVVQDEIPQGPRASYQELDRKGSSCPTLYSWDGSKYTFVTDIIGPGVVGEWVSPGVWNSPDPDEYVRLEAEQAKPRDGRYQFKVLSQMEEVTYLDAAKLIVLDTPPGIDVYPNDRYQPIPPYPGFKLWQSERPRPPESVVDGAGRDLRREIAHRDGVFAPVKTRPSFPGFAETHSIIIDAGELPSGSAQLLMHGYTAYFDSTSNYSAYHSGLTPIVPYLEAADGRGGWVRKSESIGIPAGLPKTIVVDLTGMFVSRDHRVRITTNMEIYWDQILVNTFDGSADMRTTALEPQRAELGRGGYPLELRKKPEAYDYDRRSQTDAFRVHGGAYTRLGDVTALLERTDDMFAIMASGDEITIEFDASALPGLTPGWNRTLLFFADGFEKPMETYTPEANSVEPLPFHAMSRYPYPSAERYPETSEHVRYRLEYNTRRLNVRPPLSPVFRRSP